MITGMDIIAITNTHQTTILTMAEGLRQALPASVFNKITEDTFISLVTEEVRKSGYTEFLANLIEESTTPEEREQIYACYSNPALQKWLSITAPMMMRAGNELATEYGRRIGTAIGAKLLAMAV